MKNKKNTIMLVVLVISLVILTWNKSYSYEINDNIVEEKEVERKEFGIYLEKSQGSSKTDSDYTETTIFPKQGYLLNANKTKCYEYGTNKEVINAVTQSLTKGVIDGSIIVESTKSIYCKIYFDKDDIKPTIKAFELTGNTDNGTILSDNKKYTHTTKVNYTLTWNDEDVAQICAKENGNCAETDWIQITGASKSGTINVTTEDGSKEIYVYLKDKANNISEVQAKSITLDTTNPSITLTEDASKITENSITVTVEATDTNGIKSVTCKAEGNSTIVDGEYSDTDKTCIFNDLKAGMGYMITGEVEDNSGRRGTSEVIKITTKKAGLASSDLLKEDNRPKGLSDQILGESPEDSSTYNDDMYRFVGACNAGNNNGKGCDGKVDNFVCFGYDNPSQCVNKSDDVINLDNDYIYRIIGITRDGKLKLIKNTAIREGSNNFYIWYKNYTEDITWPSSYIYKRLNGQGSGSTQGYDGNTNLFINSETSNVQYIKTTGDTTWYNKIDSSHEWLYGGIYDSNLSKPADEIYKIETGKQAVRQNYDESATSWTSGTQAAVGLMYVSDFYYSYASSGTDSSKTNCYSTSAGCKNSWLHISQNGKSTDYQYEWTMTCYGRASDGYNYEYYVTSGGNMTDNRGGNGRLSVRPVFFLQSTVRIVGGDGTVGSPFIIEGTK